MKNVPAVLKVMLAKSHNNKVASRYLPSGILKYLDKSQVNLEKTAKLFAVIQSELGKTTFSSNTCTAKMAIVTAPSIGNTKLNLDASTQAMIKIVDESKMRANGKIFAEMISADLKND